MDQCGNCEARGNLEVCRRTDCSLHESWYAKAMAKQLKLHNSEYAERKGVKNKWNIN